MRIPAAPIIAPLALALLTVSVNVPRAVVKVGERTMGVGRAEVRPAPGAVALSVSGVKPAPARLCPPSRTHPGWTASLGRQSADPGLLFASGMEISSHHGLR